LDHEAAQLGQPSLIMIDVHIVMTGVRGMDLNAYPSLPVLTSVRRVPFTDLIYKIVQWILQHIPAYPE